MGVGWKPPAINRVLDEIENNKGEESKFIYPTSRKQALEELRRILVEDYSMHALSIKQINQFLRDTWHSHRKCRYGSSTKALFVYGRDALDAFCDRNILQSRANDPDQHIFKSPLAKRLITGKEQADITRQSRYRARMVHLPSSESTSQAASDIPRTSEWKSDDRRGAQLTLTPGQDPTAQMAIKTQQGDSEPEISRQYGIKEHSSDLRKHFNSASNERVPTNQADHKRLEGLTRFLERNPAQYKPNAETLEELRSCIVGGVEDAVSKLFVCTATDPDQEPRFFQATADPSFFGLCDKIYRINSRLDFLDCIASKQGGLSMPLSLFLRAIIAAAINDWVLEGQHNSLRLPHDSSWYTKALEETLMSVSPGLLERVSLRSKQKYIDSDFHPEQHSKEFAFRLEETLRLFLEEHLNEHFDHTQAVPFLQRINAVVVSALKLAAQVSLLAPELSWDWVYAGTQFDAKRMQQESGHQDTVRACLFPGLVGRRDIEGDPGRTEEVTIVPALVALKP